MRYFKKLLSLGSRAIRKMAYLIRERFDLIEVKILSIGLLLTLLLCGYLLLLLILNPRLYGVLSSTAVIHLMGGRGLGIATCLSAGLSTFVTIAYNFFLEIVIVLVAYGMAVLVIRNVIEPKLFKSAVRQAELTAQEQKTKIKRYGAIGLFLFVMFPFFMTGPVIGAIIGYLLHYKAINNFLIVFSGTLTSIVVYALIGNSVLEIVNRYVDVEQVRTWGAIIVGILILIFAIYHIGTVKRFLDQEDEP